MGVTADVASLAAAGFPGGEFFDLVGLLDFGRDPWHRRALGKEGIRLMAVMERRIKKVLLAHMDGPLRQAFVAGLALMRRRQEERRLKFAEPGAYSPEKAVCLDDFAFWASVYKEIDCPEGGDPVLGVAKAWLARADGENGKEPQQKT